MQKFKVEYYRKQDGSCPTEEFMDSLEKKMRAKLLRLQLLLEQNGNELREPYSKHLEDGIFELRTQQGNNIARALYFFMVGQKNNYYTWICKKDSKNTKK